MAQRTPASTIAEWIAARLIVNPAFMVGLQSSRHDVETLLRLLQRFDQAHFGDLAIGEGDAKTSGVTFEEGQLRFMGRPIDRLASGYVALLKILQEVVASISAWEAIRNSTDILGSDALVFIDAVMLWLKKFQNRMPASANTG